MSRTKHSKQRLHSEALRKPLGCRATVFATAELRPRPGRHRRKEAFQSGDRHRLDCLATVFATVDCLATVFATAELRSIHRLHKATCCCTDCTKQPAFHRLHKAACISQTAQSSLCLGCCTKRPAANKESDLLLKFLQQTARNWPKIWPPKGTPSEGLSRK